MHEITSLPVGETITPELHHYIRSVRDGFLEHPLTDEGLQWWLRNVREDGTRLRAVYDGNRPFGLAEHPVATFASWDGSLNTGRGLAPANLLTDVTVQASHRRRGLMKDLMLTDLAEARERGAVFSALTATDALLYARFGFGVSATARSLQIETGPRFQLHADPAGSCVFAEPGHADEVRRELFGAFHTQQFWSVQRPAFYFHSGFDWRAQTSQPVRAAIHLDAAGQPDGAVTFLIRDDHILIQDLLGLDQTAELELLRLLAGLEGVNQVRWPHCFNRRFPLTWALSDHRVVRTASEFDTVWVRIMDIERALQLRQFDADGVASLHIVDPLDEITGTYTVEVSDGEAAVTRSAREADLTINLASFAGVYSGLAHPFELAASGTVSGSAEGIARVGRLFAKDLPGVAAAIF